jgi:hypothetical protein
MPEASSIAKARCDTAFHPVRDKLAYTSQRIGLVRITADSISHKLSPHGRAVRADVRACHRHAMTTPLFQLLDHSGTAFGAGS